jgi:hypothetical protein
MLHPNHHVKELDLTSMTQDDSVFSINSCDALNFEDMRINTEFNLTLQMQQVTIPFVF